MDEFSAGHESGYRSGVESQEEKIADFRKDLPQKYEEIQAATE